MTRTFHRAATPAPPPPARRFKRASREFRGWAPGEILQEFLAKAQSAEFKFFGHEVPRDYHGRWTSGLHGGRWNPGFDPLSEIPSKPNDGIPVTSQVTPKRGAHAGVGPIG